MIYFYMWVLFLVSILLALPIVVYVEKSRLKKAMGPTAAAAAATGAAAVAFDDEPVEEVLADDVADDGMGEFGETAAAADDFSAFEDFK